MREVRRGFRRRYGAGPLHLLGLIACFALAGYAVLRWLRSPQPVRLLVWFAGALILHDLVLFPVYTALDRAWQRLVPPRRPARRVPLINHVRVPALLSGLLLLLWFPMIFHKSEPAYRAATGLSLQPYRARYLAVVAVLFGGSAVLYGVRYLLARRRERTEAGSSAQRS